MSNMATVINRICTKSAGVDGWIQLGGQFRADGKLLKVTKIEAGTAAGSYKVTGVEGGYHTYDAEGTTRPLFAVNAIPTYSDKLITVTVSDVTAVEEVEAEEEKKEDTGSTDTKDSETKG